jgi:hypothetical protein
MTKEHATKLAIIEAVKHGVDIAVINDPIMSRSNGEETPYQYCAVEGVSTLFKGGTIERIVSPNGTILDTEVTLKSWGQLLA